MIERKIIEDIHHQFRHNEVNPDALPYFEIRLSEEELGIQLSAYKEIIDVTHFFVEKFLNSVSGNSFLVAISDEEGYILAFDGDPRMIEQVERLGIVHGVQFNEKEAVGINSVALCLRFNQPIQLIGKDHYHKALHGMACYSAPFYSESGERLLGTISMMMDIDAGHPHMLALLCTIADSVERELLLRKQNTQLHILNQALLDNKYYGVIMTDGYGTIMDMNESSLAMMQVELAMRGQCIGRSVLGHKQIGPYFQQVIDQGEECVGVELIIEAEDKLNYYMLDVLPIYDHQHTLIRVVGSLRDITEMKITRERLQNAEKLVIAGQMAVSIAHEIRNPLTTVKGMLQFSKKNTGIMHYELIMSELERMNLIVSEFLILGKPQAVQYKDESSMMILQEVLDVFNVQASMNGIIIECECKMDHVIRCDRNQIKQVFLNILKNAMEALPFGGTIEIVLDVEGDSQHIRFTDSGEGMTEEVIRRLGEPFHTTRSDGNGLGIMIVRNIVHAHEGHMTITSVQGEGTSVDIWLPAGPS